MNNFELNKKPTILVIDDNPNSMGLIENYLEEQGVEMLVARDGLRGIEKAEFAHPDLILLDVIMPGLDGFETCRRLKASDAAKNIPVIFLTALTESEDKVKGFQVGAVDYITKPIQKDETVARVMTHLRLKELNENLEQLIEQRTRALERANEQLKKEIADRKQVEKALKKSEERFELAMKFANDGLFDWDLEHEQIYFSPGWKRMLGYEDHEILNEFSEWERLTEKDGVIASLDMVDEILEGKRHRFENEFKMLHKDGHWVDILSRANVVFDEQGKGVRVVGTHVDISDRKRNELQIKSSLKEKEVLIQEIHHRVKNNMQVIISLLKLQADRIADEQFRVMFLESQSRIYAMAAVHETLHQSDNLARIDLAAYLSKLGKTVLQTYNTNSGEINLILEVEPIELKLELSYPIGLVFNELMSNTLKHAFTRGGVREIRIYGGITADNKVNLVISDDGVGLPADFDWRAADSLGLQIVRALVEDQLEGSINLDSTKGTKWGIVFPIES